MFGCPLDVWTPPRCLDAPISFSNPHMFGHPQMFECHQLFGYPRCLDTPQIFGCPHMSKCLHMSVCPHTPLYRFRRGLQSGGGSWRGLGFQCVASPHTSKLKSQAKSCSTAVITVFFPQVLWEGDQGVHRGLSKVEH